MSKRSNTQSLPQQMVPQRTISISVEEIAAQIFVKTYMDTSGKTVTHLAEKAFEAAEAFVSVSESRQ